MPSGWLSPSLGGASTAFDWRFGDGGVSRRRVRRWRPRAVAHALADSPAGQAAWILQLLKDFSDIGGRPLERFSLDELIDDIMRYRLPNAAASSARLCWEEAPGRADRSGGSPINPGLLHELVTAGLGSLQG